MANYSSNRPYLLGSLAVAIALLAGCNKSSDKPVAVTAAAVGRDAASVNGETISLTDYYDHMSVKQSAQVMTRSGASEVRVIGSFGLQSLQELVDQKILLQMAKEQGLTPTEAEIDAELKLQEELRPDYVKVLQDQGLTTQLIRNELRVGLAREHLIMKGVTVDPADVDKYIKDHPEKFSDPERANLLFIQAASADAKRLIDAELSSGKGFRVVASQHAKQTGGAYPLTIVSQMPKQLQDLVKKTLVNGTTDWITNGHAFFKFFVDAKTPAKLRTPTAPERELVRRGIALQKGALKNDFDHLFFEKLREAKVDISVPNLKEPWAKTWNQLSGPSAGPGPARSN